jgi:hypothetical protein
MIFRGRSSRKRRLFSSIAVGIRVLANSTFCPRSVSPSLPRPTGPSFRGARAAPQGVRASRRQTPRSQRHRHCQLLAVFGKRSMPRALLSGRGRLSAAAIVGRHATQGLAIKPVTHQTTPEVSRRGTATVGSCGGTFFSATSLANAWQVLECVPIDLATDPARSSDCSTAPCRFGTSATPPNEATAPAGMRKSTST